MEKYGFYGSFRSEFLVYSLIQNLVVAMIQLEEIRSVVNRLLGEENTAIKTSELGIHDPISSIELRFRSIIDDIKNKIDLLKSYGKLATTNVSREQIETLIKRVEEFRINYKILKEMLEKIDDYVHISDIRDIYNDYLAGILSNCLGKSSCWEIEKRITSIGEFDFEKVGRGVNEILNCLVEFIAQLFPDIKIDTSIDRYIDSIAGSSHVDTKAIKDLEKEIVRKIVDCIKSGKDEYELLTENIKFLKQVNRDIEKLLSLLKSHNGIKISIASFKKFSEIVDELWYVVYEYGYLTQLILNGEIDDLKYVALIFRNAQQLKGRMKELYDSLSSNINSFRDFLEEFAGKLYDAVKSEVNWFKKEPTIKKLELLQDIFMYTKSLMNNLKSFLEYRRIVGFRNIVERLGEVISFRREALGSLLDTINRFKESFKSIIEYRFESVLAAYDENEMVKYQFEFFKELLSQIEKVLLSIDVEFLDLSKIEEIAEKITNFIGQVIDYIMESGYFKRTIGIDWAKMFSKIIREAETREILKDFIKGKHEKYDEELAEIIDLLKEKSRINKYTNFRSLLDASFKNLDALEYSSLKYLWFKIILGIYEYARDRVDRAVSSFMLVRRPVE